MNSLTSKLIALSFATALWTALLLIDITV